MIFYFSATGNTLEVAKTIAEKTGENLIYIPAEIKSPSPGYFVKAGERVGIVSPVYFWGLPVIVRDFIKKASFHFSDEAYVYFVATYGTATGQAAKQAEDLLADKGISLSATFSVKTVDNYFPVFNLKDKDKNRKILKSAAAEAADAAVRIKNRNYGQYLKDSVAPILVSAFYPTYEKKRKTKRFYVEDTCVGCGLCERNCPVDAINIKDGKPVWVKDKCVLCFACVHKCPVAAIQYNRKNRHGQYVNPNV